MKFHEHIEKMQKADNYDDFRKYVGEASREFIKDHSQISNKAQEIIKGWIIWADDPKATQTNHKLYVYPDDPITIEYYQKVVTPALAKFIDLIINGRPLSLSNQKLKLADKAARQFEGRGLQEMFGVPLSYYQNTFPLLVAVEQSKQIQQKVEGFLYVNEVKKKIESQDESIDLEWLKFINTNLHKYMEAQPTPKITTEKSSMHHQGKTSLNEIEEKQKLNFKDELNKLAEGIAKLYLTPTDAISNLIQKIKDFATVFSSENLESINRASFELTQAIALYESQLESPWQLKNFKEGFKHQIKQIQKQVGALAEKMHDSENDTSKFLSRK